MTTILVTGAAGFIGRHIVKSLSDTIPGAHIIGLDRDSDIPPCYRRVVCDLSGPQTFQIFQTLEPIDYVIHLAAQSDVHFSFVRPDLYVRDNVLATSNLLQALRVQTCVKRLILVSSCEVYGNIQSPASEVHDLKPRSPYAASKLAQEYLALAAIEHQILPTVVCRLFNNYGRGQQSSRLIPRIMQALQKNTRFELVGDGSQTRDWIAVEDTCDALIRVLLEPKVTAGDVFNVAGEEVCSVSEILELCGSLSNRPILIQRLSKNIGHLETSAGSSEKLRSITGWRKKQNLPSFIAAQCRDDLVLQP